MEPLTVDDVRTLAREAHASQTDKLGRDYFPAHVEAIAARLEPDGDLAVMAGLLHDVLEDTDLTADDLLARGVPAVVVEAVLSVSKRDDEPYERLIERARQHPLGRLVKLADNAQNLADNPALAEHDPATAARLLEKYTRARETLLRET